MQGIKNYDTNTARVDKLFKVDKRVKLKRTSLKLEFPKPIFMKISMIKIAIEKSLPLGPQNVVR